MTKNILYFFTAIISQLLLGIFFDLHWTAFIVLNMILAFIGIYRFSIIPKYIWSVSFLSVFLVWLGYTLYIDSQNSGIMSQKMAVLLGAKNRYLLIFVQSLLGGFLSLLSGLVVSSIVKKPTI